jgi:ribosomal protein L33
MSKNSSRKTERKEWKKYDRRRRMREEVRGRGCELR